LQLKHGSATTCVMDQTPHETAPTSAVGAKLSIKSRVTLFSSVSARILVVNWASVKKCDNGIPA